MKKRFLLAVILSFFGNIYLLKAQFIIDGDASTILPQCNANSPTYQLTPNLSSQSGQIWDTTPINLTQRFDVQFEVFLGTQAYNVGADGMCFVLQPNSNDTGASGGGLGYEGMKTSLAVEFDTYQNGWDPPYCHTAIEKNGDIDHTDLSGNNLAGPVQLSPSKPNLPDGEWHRVEIIWNSSGDSISVYFDCSFRLSYKGDIVDSIFGGNPVVYWGFTGGTGADHNSQQVCITNAYTISDSIVNPSCHGNDGKAIITVNGGNNPFTYSWSPNVSSTATATGLSTGVYIVKVYSPSDSCVIPTDTIKLVGPTAVLSTISAKCSRANSGQATITISNGSPPYTYTWSNGSTNQTDTGLLVGKYYITVTDHKGCVFIDSVSIGVDPPPIVTTIPAMTDTICFGASGIIGAAGGKTYTWLPAADLSCNNCPSPTASPTVTTTYTVTGTDSNGCTNTASIVVRVTPLPIPIVTGIDTICIGNSTTLTATGGSTYLWNPGASTGSTLVVRTPVTRTYTLTATTKNGCSKDTTVTVTVVAIPRAKITASKDSVCPGDSLTLEASGGTTYRWSPGNSTNLTLHVNPISTTTYTLYAYGGTCMDSATITLNTLKSITATIGITKDSICPHGSTIITASGSGGPVSYLWSNGATSSSITVSDTVTKTYTVVVYGRCDTMPLSETVHVIPLPIPVVSGTTSLCAGTKDTLTVSSSVNPTTYLWSTGQRGTSIVTSNINSNTTIYVTAYNSLGCSKVDTFHISIKPYPTANITYNTECGNTETLVSVVAGGQGPFTYLWNTGGTNDTIEVNIQDTATFTVVVSNGCSISREILVRQDIPTLSACCSTTILLGQDTTIAANGTNIVSYQWIPGDGLNCTTCSVVTASPTVTTTYTVIGTDTAGCPIERTVTITVETPCFDFIVPNVFTPTEKGINGLDNVLYIQTKNIKTWSLLIFDRWGHEVYKSTNPIDFWDGSAESGGKAPEGVYYYVIDATCINADYKKDGFVQLIR